MTKTDSQTDEAMLAVAIAARDKVTANAMSQNPQPMDLSDVIMANGLWQYETTEKVRKGLEAHISQENVAMGVPGFKRKRDVAMDVGYKGGVVIVIVAVLEFAGRFMDRI